MAQPKGVTDLPETMITSVMISCRDRTATRQATLERLERIGITPRVTLSECDPPSGLGTIIVGIEAVEAELKENPQFTHLLFLEDDVKPASNASTVIMESAARNEVVYLYLHDTFNKRLFMNYPREVANQILSNECVAPGYYYPPSIHNAKLYGSQAVLMPRWALPFALEYAKQFTTGKIGGFDTCMLRAWQKHDVKVSVRVPHVFQHLNDTTLHEGMKKPNPRVRVSKTFI